jgi:hypothetical protein
MIGSACYDRRFHERRWGGVSNRIFGVINIDVYFPGLRFINTVREIEPYFDDYNQFIEKRNHAGQSTSRKKFFYDILRDLDPARRAAVMT